MMTLAPFRIVYLPVGYAEAADRIAILIEAGVLRIQPHWTSREACQAYIETLPGSSTERGWYRPTAAIIRDAVELTQVAA